ncbi:MAG: hemerythrin domain-containing protein [Deltaproteobacteria bacterium]|nr:MAG: hemerythrin domain-containing protein [Deltaproteobacteria bacterium]
MLQSIGRGPRAAGPRDVVTRLADCHERIRRHTAIARRLAAADGATTSDIRAAAAQVVSYFGRALPLHSADEDESIAPRLSSRGGDVAAACAEMTRQHAAIHATLTDLLPLCRALDAAPERHADLRGRLDELAGALAAQFDEHLALEERVVFPAIAALPDADRAAIVAEMAARRAAPSAARHDGAP